MACKEEKLNPFKNTVQSHLHPVSFIQDLFTTDIIITILKIRAFSTFFFRIIQPE